MWNILLKLKQVLCSPWYQPVGRLRICFYEDHFYVAELILMPNLNSKKFCLLIILRVYLRKFIAFILLSGLTTAEEVRQTVTSLVSTVAKEWDESSAYLNGGLIALIVWLSSVLSTAFGAGLWDTLEYMKVRSSGKNFS